MATGSDAPDRRAAPNPAAPGADVARVANALALPAQAKAALARAQALGREATSCLVAHGATQAAGGALVDATGQARAACAAQIEANEAFLDSAEFSVVLKAAQPKLEAAARCFRRVSRIPAGKVIAADELTPELERRLAEADVQCFRPDGLPR